MDTAARRREYQRASDEGWLPFFVAAGSTYAVRPEVLMGIASRETNMGGPRQPDGRYHWLAQPGDGGDGFGLMQIDRRSFPEWVGRGNWKSAEAGIEKGAEVLRAKRDGIRARAGTQAIVRDRHTDEVYRFVYPAFTEDGLEKAAVAAYNVGELWVGYHASKGRDVDHGTTGRDYSSDVLARAAQFRVWLVADGWITEGNQSA